MIRTLSDVIFSRFNMLNVQFSIFSVEFICFTFSSVPSKFSDFLARRKLGRSQDNHYKM